MNNILYYAQLVTSIILVVLIAIQQRGTALGAGFGGGSGEVYSTRRGAQKKIYYATIAVATIFIVLGALNILIP